MIPDDETLAVIRADAARANFNFSNYLPYHLTFPVAIVSRVLGNTMESRFGLRTTHWRIMALLGSRGPASTRDLSRYLSSERSAISRATSELIARGYVLRIIDPQDRRLLMLQFSRAGKKLFERMSEVALQFEAALIRSVSRQELTVVDQVLKKLRDAALEYRALHVKPKAGRREPGRAAIRRGARRQASAPSAPRSTGGSARNSRA
jgi:DNA-binding MarR family transcriptional regulator